MVVFIPRSLSRADASLGLRLFCRHLSLSLTRKRKRAIAERDRQMVDMSEAIITVAAAGNEKKTGSVLASIQSTITRLARGESAVASSTVAPPPLPRTWTAAMLESCRLEWRRGMKPDELARRVGCSEKTARVTLTPSRQSWTRMFPLP